MLCWVGFGSIFRSISNMSFYSTNPPIYLFEHIIYPFCVVIFAYRAPNVWPGFLSWVAELLPMLIDSSTPERRCRRIGTVLPVVCPFPCQFATRGYSVSMFLWQLRLFRLNVNVPGSKKRAQLPPPSTTRFDHADAGNLTMKLLESRSAQPHTGSTTCRSRARVDATHRQTCFVFCAGTFVLGGGEGGVGLNEYRKEHVDAHPSLLVASWGQSKPPYMGFQQYPQKRPFPALQYSFIFF